METLVGTRGETRPYSFVHGFPNPRMVFSGEYAQEEKHRRPVYRRHPEEPHWGHRRWLMGRTFVDEFGFRFALLLREQGLRASYTTVRTGGSGTMGTR